MATTKKAKNAKKAETTKRATNGVTAEAQVAAATEPAPVYAAEERTIMIPIDPDFGANDQMWETNLNGRNILIKRGEWVTLPAYLADFVMDKVQQRERISPFVASFMGQDKKLN